MHFKSLKVFCDVVSERSFSRGAGENGITQSGASQIVHHLERRLGVTLLDRSKRPFVLTDAGKIYYDGCRDVVKRLNDLEERVRSLHTELSGRVHIASIYSVGLSFMQQFVHEFSDRFSRARVKLDYAHPDKIYEMVSRDSADLGLVSYPKASRSIAAKVWRTEPMVLALPPNHPLAGRESAMLSELNGLEAVGFSDNLRIRRELDKSLHSHGVSLNVAMEFDNIETLKRAIEINSGVSILPIPTIRSELDAGSLAMVKLSDIDLVRPVGVIFRKGRSLGATAQHFIDLLMETSESGNNDSASSKSPNVKPEAEQSTDPDAGSTSSNTSPDAYHQPPPQSA
jgi:DNA-binding transcriptional LysR family regulator